MQARSIRAAAIRNHAACVSHLSLHRIARVPPLIPQQTMIINRLLRLAGAVLVALSLLAPFPDPVFP